MSVDADGTEVGSLQLQLYQAVPQHPDNLFPFTRVLPVHTVPSPFSNSHASSRKPQKTHREHLAAHLESSIKSSLYTVQSQPDICIQWRLLSDRKTLELRPMRWVNSSQQQGNGDLMPSEGEVAACVVSTWCFESPLLDNVIIYDELDMDGNLLVSVTTCSKNGVIYRLSFDSVWSVSSDTVDANACTSWYQIEWCYEREHQPLLFDGINAQSFVVGCSDSSLVWLQWQHQGEARGSLQSFVVEKVTSSAGILSSVKGFIPRLLRRGGSSVGESEEPHSRIISLATTQVSDGSVQYAVTLSRDRRLRFWSSSTGSTCQHEELLPQLDVLGSPIPADPHNANSLPLIDATSRNHVRIISHSTSLYTHDSDMASAEDNIFGVLVFVSDEATPYFTLLQVSTDAHNRIVDVQTIMYKVCKATNGGSQLMADDELVDFQLALYEEEQVQLAEGPGGQVIREVVSSPYWALWALWRRAQESVLTYTYFSLRPSASGDMRQGFDFEGHPQLGERWFTVLAQQQAMQPTNDGSQIKVIEARLADLPEDSTSEDAYDSPASSVQANEISKAFLDHLFHPVRFDRGVLEYALGLYEASARDRGFDFPRAPYSVTAASPQLRQRVSTVVGSFLRVETSQSTGKLLTDEYHRALFTEWMRYSTLCARIQRNANSPRSLSVCPSTNMVCVVASNTLMMLQSATQIEWMHALSQKDAAAASVLQAAPESVLELYPIGTAREEEGILSAASYLASSMASDQLLALTDEMSGDSSGEMLVSLETRAAELFEKYAAGSITDKHVRHASRLLARCRTPSDTLRNLFQLLVQSTDSAVLTEAIDPQAFSSSSSMDGLFAAGFTMASTARYELARNLLLLLICATYHRDAMGAAELGDMSTMLAEGMAVFGIFAVAHWISSQAISANEISDNVADSTDANDGFLRRFSVLNINRRRDSAGSLSSKHETTAVAPSRFGYSLLHDILSRYYNVRFTGRTGNFADMIPEGVLQVYANLGLGLDAQVNLVQLAAKLEQSAPPEMTEEFLQLLPKSTAASYISGLVAVRMRDFAAASDAFASASVAYCQVSEGIRDGVDLQFVLPPAVLESGHAFAYFEHVAELFEVAGSFAPASQFCHRALTSLQEEYEREDTDLTAEVFKERKQKLWFKIFHAELECNAYEEAYMAMMANPDQKVQLDCLRHLTGVLCEREGGVAILCRLSFPGLQEEIEHNLLFKARHSDPLVRPSYYKILYSFHVYRGNYRNAASAMYQYARRLGVAMRHAGDVARLLVEQGQALLACVNGLSIVDRQYAWVVVSHQQDGDEVASAPDAKRKRRRIAIGRYDASANSQGQDIDIVELEDVQREYALCMARISLGTSFSELFSRNILLEPEDAVALYVKLGMYDNAIAFAQTFALKLDYIFKSLVHRCLEMSAANSDCTQREQTPEAFWSNVGIQQANGSPSERAWRLLQYYLNMDQLHDDSLHYRLLVAEMVLKSDYDALLAPWLSSQLLQRCPQDLVRLCLRHGCVSEGAEFLLEHINSLCSRISAPDSSLLLNATAKKTREFWLPYQLLDQTMSILDDAVEKFEEAVDKIKTARKQGGSGSEMARLKKLYRSYRERLDALQRLRDDLKAAVDRYMAFAARESRDISMN
ncbi:hypothetical protein LPJ78_004407 [Coemansia sp. RSA 989]|nr:nucleoporin Nup120/160-domain-containing protein [Coemansia mojavensis]KAJ1862877.1 hypothetical protein LPJ78_004407 [Coemansia sp. RSA 989]KAJ2677299.1 hypothetical protein IWW42_000105 [Coemansia sp. RSA 1085]